MNTSDLILAERQAAADRAAEVAFRCVAALKRELLEN